MIKLCPSLMCEKNSYHLVDNAFRLFKLWGNNGRKDGIVREVV